VPRLYIGTAQGLHALDRQGSPWFEGRSVTALARRGSRLWCILDGREIWRAGRDRRWRRIAAVTGPRANCILPIDEGALLGTAEAHLLRLHRGSLASVQSFDSVEGRSEWFTPWGGPPDTRSLSQGVGGNLYANVHVGGVVRSEDATATWQPTVEIGTDVHQVLAHPRRSGVVLAASAVGLGISRDGGGTWTFVTAGFHATYQRAVAVAGEIILVSTSRSERGRESAVYRRALNSRGPFEKCERGLPRWFADNVNTGCLVAAGKVAAIGTVDGLVFVSNDRGESWRLAREELAQITCLALGEAR